MSVMIALIVYGVGAFGVGFLLGMIFEEETRP